MHYKCHLFMSERPTEEKVHDIMEPFRSNDELDYPSNVRFLWSSYEVGGRYAPWNGGVMKLSNLKHFEPSDCFILLDETGKSVTRDSFFAMPGRNNAEFDAQAYAVFSNYKDNGYVVVIDILE